MEITMERVNQQVHFRAYNAQGNPVDMDGSPAIGGENKGARPTELLLMGIAGCSAIDIVNLMKKMRQPLEDIRVEVKGTKEPVETWSEFKTIAIHYILKGDIKEGKAEKIINMSLEKYCSVTKMLEKSATITSSFEII